MAELSQRFGERSECSNAIFADASGHDAQNLGQEDQLPVKMPKKVNFFSLMPENVVEINDLESQGLEDFEDCDIDEMNKTIRKEEQLQQDLQDVHQAAPKLRRNPKSFNYV